MDAPLRVNPLVRLRVDPVLPEQLIYLPHLLRRQRPSPSPQASRSTLANSKHPKPSADTVNPVGPNLRYSIGLYSNHCKIFLNPPAATRPRQFTKARRQVSHSGSRSVHSIGPAPRY